MNDEGHRVAGANERLPSRKDFLRGLSVAGLGAAVGSSVVFSRESGADAPPNVIFISLDDLGWTEFGCYGNTFNETPNIDRLARLGVRFTDSYSAGPLCSPTRAGLVTGLYPARTGVTDFLRPESALSQKHLSTNFVTIPELLKPSGYTSALIGKWHGTEDYSGEYRERPGNAFAHGFDEVILSETKYIGDGDYFHPYFFMPDVRAREEGEYLTDRLAQETVDFVTRNRDAPFFVHLSNYAVHTRLDAKPELVAKYENKPGAGEGGKNPVLAAMLESVDEQVGAVVGRLEELGIAENTLVMITSDNGGETVSSNAPLRGYKRDLYEGGIRVPFVAYWPGEIRPGGTSKTPINTVDIFPTVLDLAGIKAEPADALDGESLVPLFRQKENRFRRDALYWVYPHFHARGSIPQAAVRSGNHKLIKFLKDGRTELYDLKKDIGESRDLSRERPETTARLRRMLDAHIEETGVLPPEPAAENYPTVEFSDGFEAGSDRYTVLTPTSAGKVEVVDGALKVSGDSEVFNLFRTDMAPGSSSTAVIVEMRSFAGSQGDPQDTLFAGLIKDENNYVLIWHHNGLKRSGWDLVQDGRLVPRAGAESLAALDGEVDLSSPGSRYAFVSREETFSAYSDEGSGWEYLFTVDIGGALDLSDPAVLSGYRYGFGVRVTSGAVSLESVGARSR